MFLFLWVFYEGLVKDGELAGLLAKMEVNVGFVWGFVWHVAICEDFYLSVC